MKDIDFDELDRAVSSVLGQSANSVNSGQTNDKTVTAGENPEINTGEPAASPVANNPSSGPTLEQEVLNNLGTPAAAPVAVTTTTAEAPAPVSDAAASSPAVRRGKFMDVMHPSSVMDEAQPVAVPTGRKTISPLNPDVKPDETVGTEDVEKTSPLSNEVSSVEATVIANAPDPASDNTVETTSPTLTQEAEASTVEDSDETALAINADQGAQKEDEVANSSQPTPFIPDVKVDKRPLGGDTTTDTTATTELVGDVTTDNTAISPENTIGSTTQAPAPRELQSDIVDTENTHEKETSPEPGPEQPVSAPATSPNSEDGGHPVFDTSTYHQPLSETGTVKKKTASWVWWAAGLIACLALGGGVGAVLFYGGF